MSEPYRILDEATGAELASFDPAERGELSARQRAAIEARQRVMALARAGDRNNAIIVTGPAAFVRRRYSRQSWMRGITRPYREACSVDGCAGWSASVERGPCPTCRNAAARKR